MNDVEHQGEASPPADSSPHGKIRWTAGVPRWVKVFVVTAQSTPVNLRVTSILRPENGTWKIVHRHADPITEARAASSVVAND